MLTRKTVDAVGRIFRDIESSEKMLVKVDGEIEKETERRSFHGEVEYTSHMCQLSWPSGESGYTIYNVEPAIARAGIAAHLIDQRAKLAKLHEIIALEISTKDGDQ